jgi:hypothetical protein
MSAKATAVADPVEVAMQAREAALLGLVVRAPVALSIGREGWAA